ncbi:flavin-containing monooxygenase [Streptomyces sp. NPDC101150]|uniref:flavin-containing monooxygenase n=1 Tax=Streptomyces sp. NPDC101150 TaxID=3366114 RepID=UPI00382F684C
MRHEFEAVVIGAGFSGIGMAIRLRQAGLKDFAVLEQADDLGGTWRDHTYPGCTADVPADLYSYSFAPNPNWSSLYPPQTEIRDYLASCARRFGVLDHIRYRTRMVSARFDDSTHTWTVHTGSGEEYVSRFLILAVGVLRTPVLPDLHRFGGPAFHTAQWNHDCDLDGKRVAVIGTGASAIQIVPEIAPRADALYLFQRTPPWVLPRYSRARPRWQRRLYARLPLLQRLARGLQFAVLEALGPVNYLQPRLGGPIEAIARRLLRRSVHDPRLHDALTPRYRIGCKRILLSNRYLPALNLPHVHVVTEPITQVGRSGITTGDGREHSVDVIIAATGYDPYGDFQRLDITGSGGHTLAEVWNKGLTAHLGVTVSGFPNLFFLIGPHSGTGHTSVMLMAEAQMRYILRCLQLVHRARVASIEVRAGVQDRFTARMLGLSARTVWLTGGCRSWYLDQPGSSRGLWPSSTLSFQLRTRRARRAEHQLR